MHFVKLLNPKSQQRKKLFLNPFRSQFNPKYSVTLSESASTMFPNYHAPDSLVMIEAQLGPGEGKLKSSELKRKSSVKSVRSVRCVGCSARCQRELRTSA